MHANARKNLVARLKVLVNYSIKYITDNAHLWVHILEICMMHVKFFQWSMGGFIRFRIIVPCHAFILDVVEQVLVCVCLRKIPQLVWIALCIGL